MSSAPWLLRRPTNPTIWDDEFDADGLDPKWTRIDPATTHNPYTQNLNRLDPYVTANSVAPHKESLSRHRRGWLMTQPAAASFSDAARYEQELVGLPTDCFIWFRQSRSYRLTGVDQDGESWIRLTNGTAETYDAYALLGADQFGGQIQALYAVARPSVAYTNIGGVEEYGGECDPFEFFGIQKLDTTYHGWAASAAGNWVWMNAHTFPSAYLTFANLWFSNIVTSAPGNAICGMDFFRVLPGRNLP